MNATPDACANSNDACGKFMYGFFKNGENEDVWNWKQKMGTSNACTTPDDGSCSQFLYKTFQNEKSTDITNWKRVMGTGPNPCK